MEGMSDYYSAEGSSDYYSSAEGSQPKRPRLSGSPQAYPPSRPASAMPAFGTTSLPMRRPANYGWQFGTAGLPPPPPRPQQPNGFPPAHAGSAGNLQPRVPQKPTYEATALRAAGAGGAPLSAAPLSAAPPTGVKSDGEVIDLTLDDDDADLVYVGQKTKQNLYVQREEVCFGTLTGCQINMHTTPGYEGLIQGMDVAGGHWPAIPLTLVRGNADSFIVCARDPFGQIIGCVTVDTARALAPLMDLGFCRIQAALYSRPKLPNESVGSSVSKHANFYANVYGPEVEGAKVGMLLSQKNVFLQRPYPDRVDNLPYKNPHLGKSYAPRQLREVGYVTRSADEVRQDVNNVFDSMSQAEGLATAEPDARIKTPLIAHQKQGLAFLIAKEKARTFEQGEKENTSLWRRGVKPDGQVFFYHVITGHESRNRPPDVLGGILADMMGLGKTLQILSLVVTTEAASRDYGRKIPAPPRRSNPKGGEMPECPKLCAKTTLLISPLSTIGNWEEQIAAHVVPGGLKYYIYHGNKREQDIKKLAEYDMIITTYAVVANEYGKHARDKKFPSPLQQICFFRIVLDEAHMIREQATLQSKAVISLNAQRRWAVTGTPVQNKLDDLAALIKFLRMRPFDDKAAFNQYISAPVKNGDPDCVLTLRLLVDSITLRRLKDRIDLPPREDRVVYLQFSQAEQEIYDATAKQSSTRIDLVAKSGHVGGKHYVHVLQMILRLRLICAHGRELLGEDDMAALAGMTSSDAIDVDELDEKSSHLTPKQAYGIFNLMKETNEDICKMCEKKAQYKEFTPVDDGAEREPANGKRKGKDKEKAEEGGNKCTTIGYLTTCLHFLCLGCSPKYLSSIGVGFVPGMRAECPLCDLCNRISLFELKWDEMTMLENTEKKRKKTYHYRGPSTKVQALLRALLENRTLDADGKPKMIMGEGYAEIKPEPTAEAKPDVKEQVQREANGQIEANEKMAMEIEVNVQGNAEIKSEVKDEADSAGEAKMEEDREVNPSADLKLKFEVNPEASMTPMAAIKEEVKPESGMTPMVEMKDEKVELIAETKEAKPAPPSPSDSTPIKSVVFSCWTTHMDLIERAFVNVGIRYVRLDGRLSRAQRNAAIAAFREDPTLEVILVSLMAGGLGLNLTAASRVYVMEPQFNPAAEAQAIDRIHRLGQKRPVVTVRFIMAKSFEEKIVELQKKKTDLANLTLAQGKKMTKAETQAQKLEHLRSLFKSMSR